MTTPAEQLRHDRRDQVLSAAVRCFAAQGFHRTSMADIVAASGLSAGSVYRYYASKSDLIGACIDAVTAGAGSALSRAADDREPLSPTETFTLVTGQARALGARYGVDVGRLAINAWSEAVRDPELLERTRRRYAQVLAELTTVVVRWRDAGHLRADVDAGSVGRVLFGALMGSVVAEQLLPDAPADAYAGGLAALFDPVDPAAVPG